MTYQISPVNRNAIIYTRISSESQSLISQQFICNKFCETNGLNVIARYSEIGSARSRDNLPILKKIIENYSNFDLIVYSIDRLTRNVIDGAVLYSQFLAQDINVYAIADQIELFKVTPNDIYAIKWYLSEHHYTKYTARVLRAQEESDLISERVLRSIEYRKARGDHIGSVGYGYSLEITESDTHEFDEQFIPFYNGDYTVLASRKKIENNKEQAVIRFIKEMNGKKLSSNQCTRLLLKLLDAISNSEDITDDNIFPEFDIIRFIDLQGEKCDYQPKNGDLMSVKSRYKYISHLNTSQTKRVSRFINRNKKILITENTVASILNDYNFKYSNGGKWSPKNVRYISLRP